MRLSELADHLGTGYEGKDEEITGVSSDSRRVKPGDLFVAIPGNTHDGAAFVDEAKRNGAVAVCGESLPEGTSGIRTGNVRSALAHLASAIHGNPSRELKLIGITGSLGKTSVAQLLEACLVQAGQRVGVIGSLGVRIAGDQWDTGMTTPDATVLHAAFRRMVDAGVDTVVMEVTSHALLQERVAGLTFAVGIFTNLVPDEHLEFHPTAQHYVQTKLRFVDHLADGAPLVVDADDMKLRTALEPKGYPAVGVSMEARPDAAVHVQAVKTHARGSDLVIQLRQGVCGIGGALDDPCTLRARLPLLGKPQAMNAALAATVALACGAPQDSVERALASMRPVHRRLEVVHDAGVLVIDDTVGNPRSIVALRDVTRQLSSRRTRIVYAIRGRRGKSINERNAAVLAELVRDANATLVVTASSDCADSRNRVSSAERDAVLNTLEASGVEFQFEDTLERAVATVAAECTTGDLLLLLGAQGMDAGAGIARRVLVGRPGAGPASQEQALATS
jgi:UDP-N-acetylmuramoyl-L-alanyl-D-glutamate--2,6-diaminopimelate ligase